MTKFFAKSTNGFYSSDIHGQNIPKDSTPITDDLYQALLESQSSGKIIAGDESGMPIAIDAPPPSKEQIIGNAKSSLASIDARSIRAIREWICSQQNAPKKLIEYEAEAKSARALVK